MDDRIKTFQDNGYVLDTVDLGVDLEPITIQMKIFADELRSFFESINRPLAKPLFFYGSDGLFWLQIAACNGFYRFDAEMRILDLEDYFDGDTCTVEHPLAYKTSEDGESLFVPREFSDPILNAMRIPVANSAKMLRAVGCSEKMIKHRASGSFGMRFGLGYYLPNSRVAGKNDLNHKHAHSSALDGNVQLTPEPTNYALGEEGNLHTIIQEQGHHILMDAKRQLVHEPLVGEIPRCSFIYYIPPSFRAEFLANNGLNPHMARVLDRPLQ